MKKFDIKSIIIGFAIGAIGVSVVFAAVGKMPTAANEKKTVAASSEEKTSESANGKNDNVPSGEAVKSAVINNDKVYFNGKEIDLKKPLVTIEKDGESEPQLYMPMDELLEYMHFKVELNNKDNAVYLTMGQDNQQNAEAISGISANEADAKAIDTIQKTGNWGYIEKYIPHMSADGIKQVVDIYNSKHSNPSEHKNASDYIKN
ncbi:hypothetical protein ACUH7Y_17865 [Clostridium beijerinckii]|uniref:Copper amine oxidase-like N-terminal domain-containing protein n=3 Tax=Clostridium beijerinckii TaxID=1520 RepID=A0A7X9STJ7_CLOBE|nr:hypothetical protein [Clostridium beijerinckii]NMF07829.1 hypothetical protein [Clostridium beijerinckii]